jgi:hypothetical protein
MQHLLPHLLPPFCLCGVLIFNKTRIKNSQLLPAAQQQPLLLPMPIGNRPEGLLQEKATGEATGARLTNNKTT